MQFDIKWYFVMKNQFCTNGGPLIYQTRVLVQEDQDYSCTYATVDIEI